jgi:hypothetical protein
VWENNHAEEAKDRSGWNHTRNPDNSQGGAEAAQTHEKTPGHAAQEVPRVRGKVVDYISHSIDDGILCMNICFKDKTLFSFRFACLRHVYRWSRSKRLEDWQLRHHSRVYDADSEVASC